MKKFVLISASFALFLLFTSCNNELIDDPKSNIESENMTAKTNNNLTGFDEWGFNFKANVFKSYLINAMLGDPAFEGMPHYRQPGLVYHGEGIQFWNDLVAQYPYFPQIMPEGLLECQMEMKWNDALLNSNGEYPGTWFDADAWIMFKYKMNTETERWSQVRKLVSISTGDELIDGIWYNSEGLEIGKQSYYWSDTLIIKQVINTGENQYVPAVMPDDYVCPNWVGFGNI